MKGAFLTSSNGNVVRDFLRLGARCPESFNTCIDDNDEMLLFDLPAFGNDRQRTTIHYLSQGRVIRDNLRQIVNWHFGGFEKIGRLMDFASGYGRLTRYLIQEMPPQRITVSDIYEKGVQFQQRQFGVNGIVSTHRADQYPDAGLFDCIYVGSLFSHLPEETFGQWLRKLYSMLAPGGLLAFSVLDISRGTPGKSSPATGITFSPASESRTLDKKEYGTTHVCEEYVARQISAATGGAGRWQRLPRALTNHQDIYALSNAPLIAPLKFAHCPAGWLDLCRYLPDGSLGLDGWSYDPNGGATQVQVYAGGNPLWTGGNTFARPDVARHFALPEGTLCGWRCGLPAGAIAPDQTLVLQVTNTAGHDAIFLADSVANLLQRLAPNAKA